jgi:hypothetical protein
MKNNETVSKDVLTDKLSEPLNGVTTARVNIHVGDGNLVIDRLIGSEQMLASGTLQYFKNQGLPTRSLDSSDGHANLTLRGGSSGRPWFRFPWAACNGAKEWLIHLNPRVSSDITAHSDGGNIRLDLAGMALTRLSADTGGGNIEVVLPGKAATLGVTVKSGAGNVTVSIPGGVAARVHATTGLGKVIMDPRFSQVDKRTYQSPDYEGADHKVEIMASSGAGNVSVITL